MARFPSREGDVATLAMEIISGLTENAEDFPSPPLTVEQLKTSLDSFHRTHEAAVLAESAAAEAHDVKESGERRRHHLHETVLQRAMRQAVRASGISKRATCHSSATPLPHIYWRAATTLEPYKSCWATRTCARR